MYKILAWGDLHVHPWQENERPDRVRENYLRVIGDVARCAEDEQVDMIVFLGDLFESKRSVRTDLFVQTYNALRASFLEEGPLIWLAGNHDYYKGSCTLLPLIDGRYIGVSSIVVWNGVHVRSIPREPSPEYDWVLGFIPSGTSVPEGHRVLLESDVLFLHTDVVGAQMAEGLQTEASGVHESFFELGGRCKLVVNGHYHVPQDIQRKGWVPIHCVGAPLQHNWSDASNPKQGLTDSRGCSIITLEDAGVVTTKRIKFDQYPRFYTEGDPRIREGDFVAPDLAKRVSSEDTEKHANVKSVASNVVGQSLAAYLKTMRPELVGKEFASVLRVGMGLMHNVADSKED